MLPTVLLNIDSHISTVLFVFKLPENPIDEIIIDVFKFIP